MELKVYSIFDEKGQIFTAPFNLRHDGEALREFDNLVTGKTMISQHPSDYKLYQLANYNDVTGIYTSLAQPKFMANATDFVKVEKMFAETKNI